MLRAVSAHLRRGVRTPRMHTDQMSIGLDPGFELLPTVAELVARLLTTGFLARRTFRSVGSAASAAGFTVRGA